MNHTLEREREEGFEEEEAKGALREMGERNEVMWVDEGGGRVYKI